MGGGGSGEVGGTRTDLVGDLVQEDGNGGAEAQTQALRDGSAQSQPIPQVVQGVSQDDHPGQRPHAPEEAA